MKHELIMSCLLMLSLPTATHAQQKEQRPEADADSILAIKARMQQDSILWERLLDAVTIKGPR